MRHTFLFLTIFFFIVQTSSLYGEVGESAVITLAFPFGARSTGMGEVGTALADDESVLFYNSAGLAIKNSSWNSGSASYFFEPLLPYFDIPDLWHSAVSFNYQPSYGNLGGFGLFVNYINMGENTVIDDLGRELPPARSWEQVIALGWGFNFSEYGDTSNNFGITFKFINSYLAPALDNGTGQIFAIDLGYLHTFRSGLRFGFTLMNMGPDIIYGDYSHADPLPFTVNIALAYKKRLLFGKDITISVAAETRCDREIVKNNSDGKSDPFIKAIYTDIADNSFKENINEFILHSGFELGIMNTGFFRHGFLIDYLGSRYEETFGFGVKLLNHLNFDYSFIYSPRNYMDWLFDTEGSTGVRDKQWRISLTYSSAIRKWCNNDFNWWRSN